MVLNHPKLVDLLQMAYSAEKAAAFAYIGHANSLKAGESKNQIKQIEVDEWGHRDEVLKIMTEYNIPISKCYAFKFHVIGKVIAFSCYVIGIKKHDQILYEMAIKEKEYEDFFLNEVKDSRLLPFFEKLFSWGKSSSFNDIDLDQKPPVEDSGKYCNK
jgi:hypothetical protein